MFSLPGPQFLVLFAGLSGVVFVMVHLMIEAREAALPSDPRIRDPYAIAYLRGDTRELIRVVALSLYMRGLLEIHHMTFQTADLQEIDRAQIPVEKQFLHSCRTPCPPVALPQVPEFRAVVDEYRRELEARGLLADESAKRQRVVFGLLGCAVLMAVAIFKIKVAFATGHHNIGFLIILTGLAVFLLLWRTTARRTPAGSAALQKLRTLFASLRKRRRSSSDAVSEAALLAAVFGVYGVSGLGNLAWARMFPKSNSPGSGNSCGGGSSGCGGGGGGGGCGGCGS